MTRRHDALETLHAALLDTREGYAEALDHAESESQSTLFRDAIRQRDEAAGHIATLLRDEGVEFDADGSIMKRVHRTVVFVRGSLVGVGAGMLDGMAEGEERVAEQYRTALEAVGDEDAAARVVRNDFESQQALLERIRLARDAERAAN